MCVGFGNRFLWPGKHRVNENDDPLKNVELSAAGGPDRLSEPSDTQGSLIDSSEIEPSPMGWQALISQLRDELQEPATYGRLRRHYWRVNYLLELTDQSDDFPIVRLFRGPPDSSKYRSSHDTQAGSAETAGVTSSTGGLKLGIQVHSLHFSSHLDELLPRDRFLIEELLEINESEFVRGQAPRRGFYRFQGVAEFSVGDETPLELMQMMADTGRLFWRGDESTQPIPNPVRRLDPQPLRLGLELSECDDETGTVRLSLYLHGADKKRPLTDVNWFWEMGLLLFQDELGIVQPADLPWVANFMEWGEQKVPKEQLDGLLTSLVGVSHLPELSWPSHWDLRVDAGQPTPVLKVHWPKRPPSGSVLQTLQATVGYRYGETYLSASDQESMLYDLRDKRILKRDRAAESQALESLLSAEIVTAYANGSFEVSLPQLPTLPEKLKPLGWTLEAEGRPLVNPGSFSLGVTSGIDWFELSGGVTYAGQIVPVPVLLQAVQRQENYVRLDDGSYGVLPAAWLQKYGKYFELAEATDSGVRFQRSQALLLDALLAEQDQTSQVTMDATFQRLKTQLSSFRGLAPAKAPRTFRGQLRPYQEEGLSWFRFLQDFGFGGCLADDMGLGKTVQVLALLEQRRTGRLKPTETAQPSLVVVPRSLIFNWMDEAAKFAPNLRVLDFTGPSRQQRLSADLADTDVILTTYGILKRDIETLLPISFDYAILDEAQAIKNPSTDTAKACYLLQAQYRLTMTGTPIENHLGDLWSQFRFLNPGLLGESQAFSRFNRADCDPADLQRLSKIVQPFILRRTKQQVLKDLPEKTEQTMICEMSPKQARQYNELREHFRTKLRSTVESLGMQRAKIHVLEALLRLRQAACDGRLVNATDGARGTKIDLLLEQLSEVIHEGHKVLVFSQFTSLLKLLQPDLLKRGWDFEYLDGSTVNRKRCVERFQNDPNCRLFLISLKAGGHGLNLTAADYVYILDPWWNPAAEAQAIDRAHRLGQQRHVSAYRLIAKGTVEEKILQLQSSKRDLADSIISGNQSLIRNLSADDLQWLLSR